MQAPYTFPIVRPAQVALSKAAKLWIMPPAVSFEKSSASM
jgi:hypothetical protein